MNNSMKALVLTVICALAGCAAQISKPTDASRIAVTADATKRLVMNLSGSEVATTADDWEKMKGVWRDALAQEAKESGIAYAFQEGEPRPSGEEGTLLSVYLNDYRYVSTGARYGLGVMTGNAFIDSKVQFLDLKTGNKLGERTYNTSSTAWQGVFSAMTEKQVQAVCKDMIQELSSK